jgi:hypothetical protein
VLDLGYPGDAHAHCGGDVLLGKACLRASAIWFPRAVARSLRAPASISSGETPIACSSRSSLSRSGESASASSLISVRGVFEVEPLGDRDVIPVPALPVAGFVAAQQRVTAGAPSARSKAKMILISECQPGRHRTRRPPG